jgi:lipid-binding SYLF domain-containing protein
MTRFSASCRWLAAVALGVAVSLTIVSPAAAQTREDARLISATSVLQEFRGSPDQDVPDWLVDRAYGIAVIPDVLKAALVFGGRFGSGVMTVRDEAGRFSSPVFLTLRGGNWGAQIGAQSTDIILVFTTRRSVENFTQNTLTLGAAASVAAGPLGRAAEAAAGKNAEIFSYSRSRGLFAGVALEGSVLSVDKKANLNFYGKDVDAANIFAGKVSSDSQSARRFIAEIVGMLPAASKPASGSGASTTPLAPAATNPAPAAHPAPAAGSSAQTFPLEDAKPGSEPR